LSIFASATLSAQLSDWALVKQIQSKQTVKVTLGSGQTHNGKFVGADEEGLALLQGGNRTVKLPKEEIARIDTKSAKAKGALIGLAVGGGSMAAATAASSHDLNRGQAAALGGLPGAAIGAGLGAIIGALVKPAATIYETTPPSRTK
jgi:hypothetical protein